MNIQSLITEFESADTDSQWAAAGDTPTIEEAESTAATASPTATMEDVAWAMNASPVTSGPSLDGMTDKYNDPTNLSNVSSYKLTSWKTEDGEAELNNKNTPKPFAAFYACLDEAQPQKVKSTNVTAFVTFLKALFGVSLLSSPRVMGETGMLLGTLVYSMLVGACIGSCWLLLQARAKVMSNMSTNTRRPLPLKNGEEPVPRNIITYGELGRKLVGAKGSVLINFLIVSLHICFGSGLVAVSLRQISIVLGWEEEEEYGDNYDYDYDDGHQEEEQQQDQQQQYTGDDDDDEWPLWVGHMLLSALLFPVISMLLQFRHVKDLFWICLGGLVIYLVGCVGTMLYTTLALTQDGVWDIPSDAFEWKWRGIPNFVASTICAMEGINLALPIANQLARSQGTTSTTGATGNNNDKFIPIVTAVVLCFGFLTLSVAYLGYLSGLGGGEGTKHEVDDDDATDCPAVSYCLDTVLLTAIYQLSLACALILTLPIILYPSLELLELWADERNRQIRTLRTASNRTLGDSWNGFVWGMPSDSFRRATLIETEIFGDEPFLPCMHKHWKLRIGHAFAVCVLAVVDRQFERAFVLYKGIGLSLACFMIPCLLFVKAFTMSAVLQRPWLATAMVGLFGLGVVNMVLVGLSVFTEHNFVPVLIHEGPGGHHHGHEDDGGHDE